MTPDTDERIIGAVDAGIVLANSGLDWLALEREVGSLRGYNIALIIEDASTTVGFRLEDGRRLVRLADGDLQVAGRVTHRVTTDSATFWAILTREITMDQAYYLYQRIKAVDAQGRPDFRAASVLKRVFDEFMKAVPV